MPDPAPANPTPTPPAANPGDTQKKVVVGIVVLVAVLFGAFLLFDPTEDEDPTTACTVSAAFVGLAATAIQHGNSAAPVLQSAALTPVCVQILKRTVEEPAETVSLEVELPALGQTVSYTGTGQELASELEAAPFTTPPPEYVDPRVTRLTECIVQQIPLESC